MMKEYKMSQTSKLELVKQLHPWYLQARQTEKNNILDEFVALTGFHRKHALGCIRPFGFAPAFRVCHFLHGAGTQGQVGDAF